MDYTHDKRIIMTLDAGGTNFVFSAMQAGKEIIDPVTRPANGNNLDLCLQSITKGFEDVQKRLNDQPAAISFAFPGPADYRTGIIGDLANLPGFRGGVPLGPMLEEQFHMPVFINNDGDLYAYGEALGGILPEINNRLEAAGSTKRYHNLIGLTLGTGFGGGIVRKEELFTGDNSNAAEVWIFSNRQNPDWFAEEGISARAVINKYAELTVEGNSSDFMPLDIYEIATGEKAGHREAAIESFRTLGRYLGDTLANLLTLMDGIAVIGGGLTGAAALYMPAVMEEFGHHFKDNKGKDVPRIVQQVFNLDNEEEYNRFLENRSTTVAVPGSSRTVNYDPVPRLAVATSRIGASRAISLGAYTFALKKLDQ